MAVRASSESENGIRKVSILGKNSIHCGFELISYIVSTVLNTLPSSTYVLITDTVVASYHLKKFQDEFKLAIKTAKEGGKSAPRFIHKVIPPGETSKSRQGKADIEDFLLEHKCTRDTVVLALGGGVIGDLVGFVAATFMRGVRFVQIPTTLLAMVDSSVGGKTAIDTPHGKNLIGAFWQPEYIFIDAAFLSTLPAREFANGMAEVIKTAAIWDEHEFLKLEERSAEIFAAISGSGNSQGEDVSDEEKVKQQRELLLSVIAGSIGVKAHIVTVDERETGLRNLVNFGHTIGHAIEAVLTPSLLHGECVAIGMVLEAEVARAKGVLTQVAVGRITRTLKAYNLPTSLSDARVRAIPASAGLDVERLLDIMAIDKKNSGKEKKVVLLSRIGKTYEEKASVVADDIIRRTLCEAAKVIPRSLSSEESREVTMTTPGSKSISNRALLLAALSRGTCRLTNLLHSDDTQVMMAALQDLRGARFSWEDGGETVVVEGGEGRLSVPAAGKEIYLGNAGTAARFLTTVCTLVQDGDSSAAGENVRETVITGNARMKQRPVGPLVSALQSNGSSIKYLESQGCLPLSITPGGLHGGHIQLAASISSQYVSSILLCAPYAQEEVTLELVGGSVISQPYIDMTLAMMSSFGITATRHKDADGKLLDIYTIPKGCYVSPPEYAIESDASSATYPLAVAAITGTTCTVLNIGSASLQGDARFAIEVLRPMGCEVIQSENKTTVRGPPLGKLKAVGEIDMEVMTDAFLTACVLAAVASEPVEEARRLPAEDGRDKLRTTRIIGIANQRVKECNRIKAMIDELAKFGVETTELPDGLEVHGRPLSELVKGANIHCYDDHRVAMAFSVLGSVVPETIIEEKRCVEKTWPNWWDDLENKLGFKVEGVELPSAPKGSPSLSTSSTVVNESDVTADTDASVVIIGMRGSGKTRIGTLAAQSDWKFVDADHLFESIYKTTVREFVHSRGWEAFRSSELEVLRSLLTTAEYSKKHVISLGGGIVETPAARDLIKEYASSYGPVVEVRRETEEIVRYLGAETARPQYASGEPIADVCKRRAPWFEECASYLFVNYTGTNHLGPNGKIRDHLSPGALALEHRREVERFFGHVTGVKRNTVPLVDAKGELRRSYFLSLTYPDVTFALDKLETLTVGADAIELRVDLLRAPEYWQDASPYKFEGKGYIPPVSYVLSQLAALRQATTLPIVFTVRTLAQGGSFPNPEGPSASNIENAVFELFELAARMGAEYLDVELVWDESRVETFLAKWRKRGCKPEVIASWHDWSGNLKWDGNEVETIYERASRIGDIVKIVGKATELEDNTKLHAFAVTKRESVNNKPLIAINTSPLGQLSRILNVTLTPITHPDLPAAAAPGQLSFAQIQQGLHLHGVIPSKKFYLFGSPISQSPSPTLHNTGFRLLGLPWNYGLLESGVVDERIEEAIRKDDFGGASVTIPLKLDIMKALDQLSEHAKAIGAVNTVAVAYDKTNKKILYGDNTDWLGIKRCIITQSRSLSTTLDFSTSSGMVIGAGGTARAALYALHALGIRPIYLINRTRAKAELLRDDPTFKGYGIKVLDANIFSSGKKPEWVSRPPSVIVSTVPGSATTTSLSESNTGASLYLSRELFSAAQGVVVDMAYKPAETPFLSLAGLENPTKWRIVRGVDVLLEQGYAQFQLWTDRRCPESEVKKAVWEKYTEKGSSGSTLVAWERVGGRYSWLVAGVTAGAIAATTLSRWVKKSL